MKLGNLYWLNVASVRELVDAQHLTQRDFAAALGVSRAYWSLLVNGRRSLTPRLRRALLAALPGDESRLWRVERPPAAGRSA